MKYLPALYIAELFDRTPDEARDGMALDTLIELMELFDAAQVQSPGTPSLMGANILSGGQAQSALMVLGDCQTSTISIWANTLNSKGFSSIVTCSSSQVENGTSLQDYDAPILIGHGVAIASRGMTGRALIGMPLAELRRELGESQKTLSEIAGYQVGILAPATSTFGQAVDGLILEEARRAGYRLILEPGGRVTDLTKDANPAGPDRLEYRIVRSDDTAKSLVDWVGGSGLSRQSAQLRELLQRPGRILSRLKMN